MYDDTQLCGLFVCLLWNEPKTRDVIIRHPTPRSKASKGTGLVGHDLHCVSIPSGRVLPLACQVLGIWRM